MPLGYNVHREEDRDAMLRFIGLSTIEDLFAAIPAQLRLSRPLELPGPMLEWELERRMRDLAERNENVRTSRCFLGGGMYDHFIPAGVDAIVSRGEYLTAYTPYQPEMSQGLLQALAEYQQALSVITGLPLVNSSGYDGATSFADSAWMACQVTGRKVIAVAQSIWPQYMEVLQTSLIPRGVQVVQLGFDRATGQVDAGQLLETLRRADIAGVLFQSPNAFGVLEDAKEIADRCRSAGALSSVSFHPLLSGVFQAPGKDGVDIVTCEGQPLGIPLSAGGPGLGVFATHMRFRPYLPGRLVGMVADINGRPAYALVYEDREQHVARERATSNICSNQALHAVRALVYLSLVGESGYKRIAMLNVLKARYLADEVCKIPGVKLVFSGQFFNEFLIRMPKAASSVIPAMAAKGIFAGIATQPGGEEGDCLLVAVTEVRNRQELDGFVAALREILQ